jgi:hypothetical protein
MKIATLQKKIQALEMQRQHPDTMTVCLDCLDDLSIDCLQEFCVLRDTNYPTEEIEQMMGPVKWAIVTEAKCKMNAEYKRLQAGGQRSPCRVCNRIH